MGRPASRPLAIHPRVHLRPAQPAPPPIPRAGQQDPPTPTDAQIDGILRPARPEALRPYAAYTGSLDEGLYLRLCYNTAKEEAHEAVWAGNLAHGFVGPDGLIFDDGDIFGAEGMDLARFLEIFPERVASVGGVEHVEGRESALEECLRGIEEYGGDGGDGDCQARGTGEEEYSDGVKRYLAERRRRDPLLRYWEYHAACVVTHLFIEDAETLEGKGLLHVFLDDIGNVVRQWRTDETSSEDFDFDGSWKEGVWRGEFEMGRGVLGDAYRDGGIRGPPYEL
ncbi:uncharacterized protein DSM5745_01284 [Aspergillus mulundensis]|uniref:Uncharacterized protein n=1 Tax=Aspergillus mulundensis TaxID=1810919 RepID=A0A3D8T5W9_9EURO|nr:Uncharacterized protein DSM5745_01284 [Aspergillus mulundensis]RDW93962.1 Uncharacterized protein DSM5745_01284 [Aspergillus mulundensis]